MLIGVISCPVPHHRFNGRIHIKRVSKTRYMQKNTAHTNGSDDVLINNKMKNDNWRTLVTNSNILS